MSQVANLQELLEKILPIAINSKRSGNDIANPKEIETYKRKARSIRRCTSPGILRISSHMAPKSSKLLLHHIEDLEALIRSSKLVKKCPKFNTVDCKCQFFINVVTDASMPKNGEHKLSEGFIAFRRYNDTVHPIDWCSRQVRRFDRSSATVETIAAAHTVDPEHIVTTLRLICLRKSTRLRNLILIAHSTPASILFIQS